MAIDLVTKFQPYVDEMFTTESKKSLLTNQDFNWSGAHTVKVYKVSTATMTDYDRAGTGTGRTGSRYGAIQSLNATTEEMTLKKIGRSLSPLIKWMRTKQPSSLPVLQPLHDSKERL